MYKTKSEFHWNGKCLPDMVRDNDMARTYGSRVNHLYPSTD
ncbi:MAG: hypothetical protein V4592_13435 [Bacteroidota bacterium]